MNSQKQAMLKKGGNMIGAIIGDIVGSRFEFNNTKHKDFMLFTTDSSFTDDTICTIAVADAILQNIPFGESLRYWCRKYPNPKGAYGVSFGQWVLSDNPKPYYSYGNGSAMRVSPCAYVYDNLGDVLMLAASSARCTHDHPEGIKGAMAIADCIFVLRNGYTKDELEEHIAHNYRYNLSVTCDEIRATNSFNETCQVTVPQAITCFLESTSFEDAIRLAVSIGGDSDTIAAITGSIAEAHYSIPEHIRRQALLLLPPDMLYVVDNFTRNLLNNKEA